MPDPDDLSDLPFSCEQLDDDQVVLRLARQSDARKINSNAFDPSRRDKESDPVRISVWERSRTTVPQALAMMRVEGRRLALWLRADDIRAIQDPHVKDLTPLDVCLDPREGCFSADGSPKPGREAGCEGHAAITDTGTHKRGRLSGAICKRLIAAVQHREVVEP